jgi:hypothetical protein
VNKINYWMSFMKKQAFLSLLSDQKGVSAVIIAICLFMLVGFIALAIDASHIIVARNELQNAADAGALAGARFLYTPDMTFVNTDANLIAYNAAIANASDQTPVEVYNPLTNANDVQRGHWSFKNNEFTPSNSLAVIDIIGKSEEELDAMPDFINAVQVIARRKNTQIKSFFAKIFGIEGFDGSAKAIAYIGFAGDLARWEIDQPIAICAESLVQETSCLDDNNLDDCVLVCNEGRMLDSGTDKPWQDASHNTAAWTNFTQDPCSTADASTMKNLICTDCPKDDPDCKTLSYGQGMGATGGVQQVTFDKFKNCWIDNLGASANENQYLPDIPWSMKLPVVLCPGNNVSNCATLIGAVEVETVWVSTAGTPDPSLDTPWAMEDWNLNNIDSETNILENTFGSLETEFGFPEKYFEPQQAFCGDVPSYIIPAPVTRGQKVNKPFLKTPDPGTPPYDVNKICTENAANDALAHRIADAAGMARWASFVKHFKLLNSDGKPAPLAKKSIYFKPSCKKGVPTGGTGGENFGVLAKIPVLVK